MNRIVLFAAAVAVTAGVPLATPADAGTQCKSSASVASAWSSDQVDQAWVKAVKNKYGSAWANLSLARSKRYYDQSLLVERLYSVTAIPCRHT